MYMEVKQGPRD